MSPQEQGGRVVLIVIRQRVSESHTARERELVHISWDRIS